jgi:hypothetical protein
VKQEAPEPEVRIEYRDREVVKYEYVEVKSEPV